MLRTADTANLNSNNHSSDSNPESNQVREPDDYGEADTTTTTITTTVNNNNHQVQEETGDSEGTFALPEVPLNRQLMDDRNKPLEPHVPVQLHESRQTRASSLTQADLVAIVTSDSMWIAGTSTSGNSSAFGPYRDVELQSVVSHSSSAVGGGAGDEGEDVADNDDDDDEDDGTVLTRRYNASGISTTRPSRSNETTETDSTSDHSTIANGEERHERRELRGTRSQAMNDGTTHDAVEPNIEESSNINTISNNNNNNNDSSATINSLNQAMARQNQLNVEQNDESNDIENDVDESHWPSATTGDNDNEDDDYDENHDRPPPPRSTRLSSNSGGDQHLVVDTITVATSSLSSSSTPAIMPTTPTGTSSSASQATTLIQDDPSPYSRLTKHVQSYLSATTPGTSSGGGASSNTTEASSSSSSSHATTSSHVENTSASQSSSSSSSSSSTSKAPKISAQIWPSSSSHQDAAPMPPSSSRTTALSSSTGSPSSVSFSNFEPKSTFFWPLVADYKLAKPRELKKRRQLEPQARSKLVNLFTNFENYYTTMLVPIEENFGLATTTNTLLSPNEDNQEARGSETTTKMDESSTATITNRRGSIGDGSKRMRQTSSSQTGMFVDNSNNNDDDEGTISDSDEPTVMDASTDHSDHDDNNSNNNDSHQFATPAVPPTPPRPQQSSPFIRQASLSSSNRSLASIASTTSASSSSSLATDNSTSSRTGSTSKSTTTTTTSSLASSSSSSSPTEFHLCALCGHCLVDPITLICGCSFCKLCWAEYNHELAAVSVSTAGAAGDIMSCRNKAMSSSSQSLAAASGDHHQQSRTTKRKLGGGAACSSSNESGTQRNVPPLSRCFTCSRVHEHNTLELLKTNVTVSTLVDRLWHNNVEIRRLRNDIRAYVCYCLDETNAGDEFDVNLIEYLFNGAYTLDPSNHLILADLFILNYFYDRNPTCLKYARMACDLRSNWAFAYFMKAIYYEYTGDFINAKSRLGICLQLEPHIEPIRIKLYQLFQKSTFSIKPDAAAIKNLRANNKFARPTTGPGFHFDRPSDDSLNMTSLQFDIASTSSLKTDQQHHSSLHFDYSKYVTIEPHLVKPNELECSLCYRLLYHPVTTPCGHTFCLKCLERALDHRDQCPLCKHSLSDYLAERRQHVTVFVDRLIRAHYQAEHQERKRQQRDEIVELMGDPNQIPVFVCTLAMPFAPCPLHIYEPRYRLMVRRAIESGRRAFGMSLYTERTPYRYAEYGCLLDIKSCQFLPDGRSILSTTGSRRFRVLDSGTRDGYNVARVEWVKDVRVEEETEKAELLQLHDEVYRLALTWYSFVPQTQKNRIMEIYGISELPLPEADIQTDNGPYWHWFLLNILPLDRDYQYKFLCKTSLKDRLKQMKKIIMLLMATMRNLIAGTTGSAASNNPNEQQQQQQQQEQHSSIGSMTTTTSSSSPSSTTGESSQAIPPAAVTSSSTQMDIHHESTRTTTVGSSS